MSRGVRWFFIGSVVLVTLAGCGRGFFQYAEREPWRREAEVACLNSGTVKEGAGLVRISPIEGPGMCGADFPLKVSALGEGSALGYVDEPVRPPGADSERRPSGRAAALADVAAAALCAPRSRNMRRPTNPARRCRSNRPAPCPHISAAYPQQQVLGAPPSNLQAPPDWQRDRSRTPAELQLGAGTPCSRAAGRKRRCRRIAALCAAGRRAHGPPQPQTVPQPLPPLGPPRDPQMAAATPIEVKPAATLACPIVSALDRWFANAVQPAAHKWFNQPVVEIKQISAYSCRGMNGQAGAHISEHAFGNALDIAAFVLADGHRITVKDGWKGSPEEQGFLRDVQGSACDQFTTVLAPGSNQFHYDHIHVDLMRRASGRRICQPGAVDGEVVASLARKNPRYARRGRSSRRRRAATIRRSSRAAIRSPGAATPAAAIRPPPARSPRGGPGSRTRRPRISTGSRSRGRGRRSTGARATATRSIERLLGSGRSCIARYRGVEPASLPARPCVSRE